MFMKQIVNKEGFDINDRYLISHLGIFKVFAIWGLLESLLYYITDGNKMKEVLCHVAIILLISLFIFFYPDMKDELK